MQKDDYTLGLDVGSTTAKIALLDVEQTLVYSRYERHHARVGDLVGRFLGEIKERFGNIRLHLCVTGSVGMATAEQLGAEFVQEVVAAAVYAKAVHPEARALIDIGGEDAKVVFFNGAQMELRMNGNCAGGTGAFLDQMSVLMGIDNQRMNDLAMKAAHIYPMAARCGVFAKTDIQNLMSRNIPEADIAASIFHSVAVQTVTTLSHGCDYTPPILLCGGPLTFLPALRHAFANYLSLNEQTDFIVTDSSYLVPAMGCAIRAGEHSGPQAQDGPATIGQLLERIDRRQALKWSSGLQPLFADEEEHQAWAEEKLQYATPVAGMKQNGKEQVFLGIDSGSTTTKIIASRADGTIVFTDYAMNLGNPIGAVEKGLRRLKQMAEKGHTILSVAGSCSTGYGEELIKNAFHLDGSIIETMAHYQAARRLMPNVSFILDIGGQDMKAIFVEDGAAVRMELNEACSSGCGTFLQTFANNLNYSISDFAHIACTAKKPCELGTRCTVFMNSKVKQVMREGASVADISAGLSYSVVKNCLYKVLKLHGNDALGDNIVVQGGTMRNDAVVRALELLSGHKVARSNMPELMGAYGCALHAMASVRQQKGKPGAEGRSIDDLLLGANYETKQLQCKGCENHCYVSRYSFAGGNKFYSGNKCERIFNNYGQSHVSGHNVYTEKCALLFDRCKPEGNKSAWSGGPERVKGVIGIPRALGMYEDFPFWHTLFTSCGFNVMLSAPSTYSQYESQLKSVMSDNICFPAKLIHSHIAELDASLQQYCKEQAGNASAEVRDEPLVRLFYPYVVFEKKDDKRTNNSFNCPIVSGYSDVLKSSMNLQTPLDAPVINFSDERSLRKQIGAYLKTLGISGKQAKTAFGQALAAQKAYERAIKQHNEAVLSESRRHNGLTILLAGRPYHADSLIQHKLSDMIAALGVNVITDDIVRDDVVTDKGDTYLVDQWAYTNRIIKAATWVAGQPDDVHFVEMTSFGCGPDAFVQDEVRDIMRRHGKPFTLLKIDDVSNVGSMKLRVRSLVESLKMRQSAKKKAAFEQPLTFRRQDRRRKILAPFLTQFLSPLLPPLLKLADYDVEILPPSDSDSAQLGLTYANNEVCYPATLIVGDIIKALRSGKYDADNTALVMTQTGGQCRATNYTALIKRAMIANGFKNVPLIALGVTTNEAQNEQEGFEYPWLKLAAITTNTLLYSDALAKLYYASVSRERQTDLPLVAADCVAEQPKAVGTRSKALKEKYIRLGQECISRNDSQGLVDLIAEAARDFAAVIEHKVCQKVGIVGEIFLKFNPFSHQFLADKLIARGIEIVPPLISPFFLQEFVNVEAQKELCLGHHGVPDFVLHTIYKLIARWQKKYNCAGAAFPYFRPFTSIYEEAKGAKGIVSYAAQFGEGWLLPADVSEFYRDGIKNVVSLQPFGCIANHVVSKGIERKLHQLYPELNLLSLDFDSGVSEVNVTNRLLLFLDNLTA